MRLTIYFASPYWIGLLEQELDGLLYVGRHIFGAEPSDAQVYDFVLHHMTRVQARMTVGISVESSTARYINPKRMAREIRRELAENNVSSRAFEAMRLQLEANKVEHKQQSRGERDALRNYKREVARARAKAKHRGR
ncbi:MAG: YjdF family protein [Chloroflexota bacterium]